jgi:hypothetical protein
MKSNKFQEKVKVELRDLWVCHVVGFDKSASILERDGGGGGYAYMDG